MLQVATITSPLYYYARIPNAINDYNGEHKKALTSLDFRILQILSESTRGMQAGTIIGKINRFMFKDRFYRSAIKLIDLNYMKRTPHRSNIFFTITLSGRRLLEEIDRRVTNEQQLKNPS
jgi:hypothetical protein